MSAAWLTPAGVGTGLTLGYIVVWFKTRTKTKRPEYSGNPCEEILPPTTFHDGVVRIHARGRDTVTCTNVKCNSIWPVGQYERCPACNRPL